jgi:hypothetical protein
MMKKIVTRRARKEKTEGRKNQTKCDNQQKRQQRFKKILLLEIGKISDLTLLDILQNYQNLFLQTEIKW